MEKYAVSNSEGVLTEDITKEEFLTAKAEGNIVWISIDGSPWSMVVD